LSVFTHIGAGSNPEAVTSAAVPNEYSGFKTRNRLGGRGNILEREIQHDKDRQRPTWRGGKARGWDLSVHVPPVLTAVAVAIWKVASNATFGICEKTLAFGIRAESSGYRGVRAGSSLVSGLRL
jgi:hypothetical protein